MMPSESPEESPERELTDISLREEREEADRKMTANRVATEKHADAVVEHARENADAVLVAAREKADKMADTTVPHHIKPQLLRIVRSKTQPCVMNGLRQITPCAASATRGRAC